MLESKPSGVASRCSVTFKWKAEKSPRLLQLGQDYVRRRLAEGSEDIPEEEVRDYLINL